MTTRHQPATTTAGGRIHPGEGRSHVHFTQQFLRACRGSAQKPGTPRPTPLSRPSAIGQRCGPLRPWGRNQRWHCTRAHARVAFQGADFSQMGGA